MPAWLIDTFAHARLERVFWFLLLMTVPVWLLMLLFPARRWARQLLHPLILPGCYSLVVAYLYWEFFTVGLPALPEAGYRETRGFVAHPLVFLLLVGNVQVLNLVLGCVLYQQAGKRGLRIPIELALTWLLGPLGLLAYALRVSVTALLARFKK